MTIGECANEGRDKLTLVIDQILETLGLWIEQLIAESTGKEGKGILARNGEPLGSPDVYGDDSVVRLDFVWFGFKETKSKLDALAAADIPSSYRKLMIFTISEQSFLSGSLRLQLPAGVSGSIRSISRMFRKPRMRRRNCSVSFVRRGQLDERKKIAPMS